MTSARKDLIKLYGLAPCDYSACSWYRTMLPWRTAQIMGSQIGKIALKRPHGSAGCADDDYGILVHGLSPSKMDGNDLPLQARLLAGMSIRCVSSPASPACRKRLRS